MDSRPIGIYDSGFGGLTALKRLREIMPEEDIIYFADSGRMPYGGRSDEQLCSFAQQDQDFLAGFDVKVIIAACGTISSAAEPVLKGYHIPVVGVLEPGIKRLAALPGEGPLGIIATEASIRTGKFKALLHKLSPEREIIDIPCPKFAPLIEHCHSQAGDEELESSVAEYLAPMKNVGLSGLGLCCTHYGIISESIHAFLGRELPLVAASESAADEVKELLCRSDRCGGSGKLKLYTSGNAEELYAFASRLLGETELDITALPPMEVLVK